MQVDVDAILRRQMHLIRYSKGYSNDIVRTSVSGDRKLIALIRDFMDDASPADMNALIRSDLKNRKVKALLKNINVIIVKQQEAVIKKAKKEMLALIKQEAIKINATLSTSQKLSINAGTVLATAVSGSSIESTYETIYASHEIKIKTALINSAQNNTDPILYIKGTKDQNFRNSILYARERSLRTMAETQALGVAGNTRQEVYKGYEIEEEVIYGTLDHNTCLEIGTLIKTPNGLKPIQDIIKGDLVISGEGKERSVINTYNKTSEKMVVVKLSNNTEVVCTLDHKWLTTNGWVEAQHLTSNDIIEEK